MFKHPNGRLFEPSPTDPAENRACESRFEEGEFVFFDGDFEDAKESGEFIVCGNPTQI